MGSVPVTNRAGVPLRGKNWLDRNWKWFVPVLTVIVVLCVATFVVGLFSLIEYSFRASYPYQHAIEVAKASAAVREEIGDPFQVAWFASGNIRVSGQDGHAELSIPISGLRGTGRFIVVANKRGGRWTFDTLKVQVNGQNAPINLLNPANPTPRSQTERTFLVCGPPSCSFR
jgi:hypothetical protein